ncbi:MAG: GFA family protein [Gammaproteobacteria bacterium]|nr:GFA family protein [Gammaproteobacteria bacterium]
MSAPCAGTKVELAGGCHCRAVRFAVSAAPLDSGYCHCDICRRTTGAPVLAWASFPRQAFRYVASRPTVYRSSPWGERHFCPRCGAQTAFCSDRAGDTIDVNVGCLDEPRCCAPRRHEFTAERLEWLHIEDSLPRHEGEAAAGS